MAWTTHTNQAGEALRREVENRAACRGSRCVVEGGPPERITPRVGAWRVHANQARAQRTSRRASRASRATARTLGSRRGSRAHRHGVRRLQIPFIHPCRTGSFQAHRRRSVLRRPLSGRGGEQAATQERAQQPVHEFVQNMQDEGAAEFGAVLHDMRVRKGDLRGLWQASARHVDVQKCVAPTHARTRTPRVAWRVHCPPRLDAGSRSPTHPESRALGAPRALCWCAFRLCPSGTVSEGGNQWHTVRPRDEASFKSEQQITREGAQAQLLDYLTQTGQVGRMPTRVALERAGHRELAASLIACFGGLHAAADAMGLSKRLLNEEMEARKQAKREAAQMSAEAANEAAARAAEATDAADAAQPHAADADERCLEHSHGQTAATQDAPVDDDLPPGVAVCAPCAPCAPSVTATVGAVDAPPAATVATANVAQDPASQAGNVSHPAGSGRSLDARWQYDPNNALYYQLSTQCYFSAEKWMYNKHGQWSATKPA